MVFTLRFFNAVCFIILTCLVPVLFTFYIQNVLKLKQSDSGAKRLINTTSQFHPLQTFELPFQYRLSHSTSLYPNFPYIFSACPLNNTLPFFNFSNFNVPLRHISPQLLLCLLLISLPPMAGQNLYKNFRNAPTAPRTHIIIM